MFFISGNPEIGAWVVLGSQWGATVEAECDEVKSFLAAIHQRNILAD
jgi:hypothetical protein